MNINAINKINQINIFKNKKNNLSFKGGQDIFEKSITVKGDKTEAKIYTTNVDYAAINQIREFCNHPVFKDAPIRIMPDVHAGVNSVVGFSAPVVNGKIIPNIIGGDIGCGVLCVKFNAENDEIDFEKLDTIIRRYVSTKSKETPKSKKKIASSFEREIDEICRKKFPKETTEVMKSLGTLGGGNHFIEIDKDDENNFYLIIHTGSRKFGKEVNKYHQGIANTQNPYRIEALSYLSGAEAQEYLEDAKLAAKFSQVNRRIIADEIIQQMGWEEKDAFESIHNYISKDDIIRKGAIEAKEGKKLIIPLNMRDGCIIGEGKGNIDWNKTAPHGAGRQYKRSVTSNFITLEEYKKSMNGIYSNCINASHIDESPQAYKNAGEIIDNIDETVEIVDLISPIFNYKD